MKVKENIGIINALIRITAGLTILAWATTKMTRMPWRNTYLFMMICGAMKVAEGIVRYCPITALLQKEECCIQLKTKQTSTESDLEEPLDYNPT
nr:DUF2892 domain-containing protein [Bacillus benzoevorans]